MENIGRVGQFPRCGGPELSLQDPVVRLRERFVLNPLLLQLSGVLSLSALNLGLQRIQLRLGLTRLLAGLVAGLFHRVQRPLAGIAERFLPRRGLTLLGTVRAALRTLTTFTAAIIATTARRGFPLGGWGGEEPQKLVRKLTVSHDSPCETSTRPQCEPRNLNNPPVITEQLNRRRPIRREFINRRRHQPRLTLQTSATHPTTSETATSHTRSGVTNIHALNL